MWRNDRLMRTRSLAAVTLAVSLFVVLSGCVPIGLGTTAGQPVTASPVDPDGPGRADGSADADAGRNEGSAGHTGDSVPRTDVPAVPTRAKLAIVIDDMGLGQPGSEELLAFPAPLTFAVLPGTAYAEEVVATVNASGQTALLHLPMEPVNAADNNPGADAIYVAMTDEEIEQQTTRLLDMLPGVVGVNNHMGSAATADARVMATVLKTVQQRGLFFLDSRTTADSVVAEEAERLGLPYAANDLFLDLERTVPAVKEMIAEAMRRAEASGTFIAIAHPHPSVAEALYEMIPEFAAAGIALVPVTELLTYPAE